MPWVRIDETLPSHPKFLSVGLRGIGLFVTGLCYANQHLTDGFLPAAAIRLAGEDASLTCIDLVNAGLWTTCEGGYRIHDFDQFQPSKAKVTRQRKQAKARQKKWLRSVARRRVRDASSNTTTPTRPDPTRTVRTSDRSPDVLSTAVPQGKGAKPQSDFTPTVLTFPGVGPLKTWDLKLGQVQYWRHTYPNVDVLAECRKALAWVNANGDRKKTAKGMPRFLVNWLNRAVDRGPSSARGRPRDASERIQGSVTRFLTKHGETP